MGLRLTVLSLGIIVALAGFLTGSADGQGEKARIDHILWAVPDLDKGAAELGKRMNVEPVYGGFHPGRGTANKLVSVGPHTYLEVIGPDPRLDVPEGRGADFANMEEAAISTFAINIGDADGVAGRLAAAGLEYSGPRAGSRDTPWGETLAWRSLTVSSEEFGDLIPFVIQWTTDNHPSASSPRGPQLKSLSVWHPNASGLQHIYDVLGVPVTVEEGDARIEALFAGPSDEILLSSIPD